MTFGIITHVIHTFKEGKYYAYSPYVNEMNLWGKYVDKIIIVAPLKSFEVNSIHNYYNHPKIEFIPLKSFDATSFRNKLKSIYFVWYNLIVLLKVFFKISHVHLRCPGNIGLLGCVVQIFFPKTKKTAKYAGNWDPKAKQPLSYRLQKKILSNTLLTKNMQVLVYGEWPNQTKNIKPFFTATYSEQEVQKLKVESRKICFNELISFLFVGTLSKGKQPLYAVELIKYLQEKGLNVHIDLYGEGEERKNIENYIQKYNLSDSICLKGNQTKDVVLKAYKSSHFLILPSKSEGWPKVVAEAMFWGCVPIVTPVSCVPYMLNKGDRGILLEMKLESDLKNIIELTYNPDKYVQLSEKSANWSRQYTTEFFESEIKKIL